MPEGITGQPKSVVGTWSNSAMSNGSGVSGAGPATRVGL